MFLLVPFTASSVVSVLGAAGAVAVPVVEHVVTKLVAEEATKQILIKGVTVVATVIITGTIAHHALSSDADNHVKVSRDGVEVEVKHH